MAELKGAGAPAVLHIGANESTLTIAGDAARVVHIALGHAGVPATLFRGDLPTGLELEEAIAVVEDQVMPAVRQLSGVTELVTTDPGLRDLAAAASVGVDEVLPLERVEWLFDELSRAALGSPAASLPFAPTRAAAATLLILRELMHHGGIRALACAR